MKIRCSVSMRQYTSIKEDIPYLESEQGNTILQPDTCRFLKQALERAEIKLARKEETCRAFSGLFEKPAHHRRSDI